MSQVQIQRIRCRTCRALVGHTVSGSPPHRLWRCITCGTVERRNPTPRKDGLETMSQLGVPDDRRRSA